MENQITYIYILKQSENRDDNTIKKIKKQKLNSGKDDEDDWYWIA